MNKIRWESAGTCEERDQNAVSYLGAHAHWSLGPNDDGTWSVELITRDANLDETPEDGVYLGRYLTEEEAKEAAATYERQHARR